MYIFRTLFWGTIFIVIALIIGPWLVLRFDASFPTIHLGIIRYIGATIGVFSLLFGLYCGVYLILGRSCSAPNEAGGAFTVLGPYRYMRNPLMLSVVVALWGEAVYFERLSLILYAFLFSWMMHAWVIVFEEPALESTFGKIYLEYYKNVPRWFPRLKKL